MRLPPPWAPSQQERQEGHVFCRTTLILPDVVPVSARTLHVKYSRVSIPTSDAVPQTFTLVFHS